MEQIPEDGKANATLLCNYRAVNFMDEQTKQEKQAGVCGRDQKS